ncbi:hypothetical protein NDU88_007200 [Pleurodeles waltl]|uniref:Uncharacterized protein n=1 Tax=Pleurodeles waltl TaxID=8319 RepID=A0AAV7N1L1_PLEWA|nr:hypothetical protein NDU88_007200 [Pleurodeles waltl]
MANASLPQLVLEQKEELNRGIMIFEIKEAISVHATGKTPGSDGLPPKFYKTEATSLTLTLKTVYDKAMAAACLPPNLCDKLLILLPKPGSEGAVEL